MTREQHIEYYRLALAMQGIEVSNEMSDRLIETHLQLMELGGGFSVNHASDIKMMMNQKYAKLAEHPNGRLSIDDFTEIITGKGFEKMSTQTINDQTIETIFVKHKDSVSLRVRYFQRLHFIDVTDDFTVDSNLSEIASLKVPFSKQDLSKLLDIILPF